MIKITIVYKIASAKTSKPPSLRGMKDEKYNIKKGDKIKNKPNRVYFLMVLRLGLERFLMYWKKEGVGVISLSLIPINSAFFTL